MMSLDADSLKRRFAAGGFRINDPSNTPGFPFLYSASTVRFGYVGIPTFLEEFFIFDAPDRLTSPLLHDFTDRAWEWALRNENPMPGPQDLDEMAACFLANLAGGPASFERLDLESLGARQVSSLIYVYAVALCPRITREVTDWVWSSRSPLLTKARAQSGIVVPLVYDCGKRELHHFRKRPVLRKVYYTEALRTICRTFLQ